MNAANVFGLTVIAVMMAVLVGAMPQKGASDEIPDKDCNPAAAVRSGVNTTFAWVIISSFPKTYVEAAKDCRKHCAILIKRRTPQVDQDSLADEVVKDDSGNVRPPYWVASAKAGACQTMTVQGVRSLVYEPASCDESHYYICEMPDPSKGL